MSKENPVMCKKPVARTSINTFVAVVHFEKKKEMRKGKKVNQTMKLILIFTLHVKESSNKWLFSKRFGLHLWWTTLPHIWITIIVSYLEHLHHWFYATKSFHFNVYSIILKIIIFNWKQFNAIKILKLWLGFIRNNIVNSKYFKLIFFLVIGDFRLNRWLNPPWLLKNYF